MIARVGLAPCAITTSCEQLERKELIKLHRELAELVGAHALIVLADDQHAKQQLVQAIRKLAECAPDAAALWIAVLQHRLRAASPPIAPELETISEYDVLRASWGNKVRLAMFEDERAEQLGVPENAWSRIEADGFEVARVGAGRECRTFRELDDLSQSGAIARGTDREDVWHDYLEPLVLASRNLVLFDRFLGENLMRRTRDGTASTAALGWLLKRIDELPMRGLRVTVFTKRGDTRPAELRDAASDAWGGQPGRKAIRSIEIITTYQRLAHDRYLRSDAGAVLELSAGFDYLATASLRNDLTLTYGWRPSFLEKARRAEQDARHDHRKMVSTIA